MNTSWALNSWATNSWATGTWAALAAGAESLGLGDLTTAFAIWLRGVRFFEKLFTTYAQRRRF